jgi:hypothetical protein
VERPHPVLLRSIGSKEKVTLDPPLTIDCPMVVALYRWLEESVQPAAQEVFGSPVARIIGSSYACRTVYNLPNGHLSQHAFANALDLPMFVLADGRKIDVTHGWGQTQRDLIAAAKTNKMSSDASQQKTVPDTETAVTEVVKVSNSRRPDKSETEPQATGSVVDPMTASDAKFLRLVQQGACKIFSTVLGPEANDVHRTHLHLDLQDRKSANVCE